MDRGVRAAASRSPAAPARALLLCLLACGCSFDGSGRIAPSDGGAFDAEPPVDAALDGSVGAGGALQFDGDNDLVRIQRPVAGDFTLEAWIRTEDSRSGGQFYEGRPIFHADVPFENQDFGASVLNGHFAFGTGDPDTTVESTTTVATGDWFHVAAVREAQSGTIRVLVNGVEEASTSTGNTDPLDSRETLDLGGNTIDDRYFEGTLDELRIWSIARSESAIGATMDAPLAGDEDGLAGYWRCDEGQGATVADSAGANDGLLGDGDPTRAPSWVESGAPLE